MTDKTDEKQSEHLFKPGQSGNPKGRPLGARAKLGESFISALQEDFETHGVEAIQKVRSAKPDQYLKVIASILPKDLNINVNSMDAMTDDELVKRIRDLDATIRPFLDAQGEDGDGGGNITPTAH